MARNSLHTKKFPYLRYQRRYWPENWYAAALGIPPNIFHKQKEILALHSCQAGIKCLCLTAKTQKCPYLHNQLGYCREIWYVTAIGIFPTYLRSRRRFLIIAQLIRWGYYVFACVGSSVCVESHNAYNWRAISVPSESFGSSFIIKSHQLYWYCEHLKMSSYL